MSGSKSLRPKSDFVLGFSIGLPHLRSCLIFYCITVRYHSQHPAPPPPPYRAGLPRRVHAPATLARRRGRCFVGLRISYKQLGIGGSPARRPRCRPTDTVYNQASAGAPAHDGRPPALWLRQCSCVTGAGPLPSLQLTRMSAAELKQAGDGAMSGKARPPVQLLRRSNPVRMAVDETVILLTLSLHHY